jgi:acetyl-CoA acyltransferase
MDHLPMGVHDAGPEYQRIYGKESLCMILCAEHLAEQYKIDRARQDAYAHRSHGRAIAALDRGDFRSETVSTRGLDPQGQPIQVVADLTARRDSNLERLSTLVPILSGNKSTVTAGNCSQVNVAAAGVTLMRETTANELGLRPMARLLASADVGVPPIQMGLGPVPAIRLALKRAGISITDIDQWEINEAFAAQVLSVIDLLGLDEECVNPRGGAISLGHPLGATGARLVVSLCHAMARGEVQRGVVALCVGGGQGVAAVFERV